MEKKWTDFLAIAFVTHLFVWKHIKILFDVFI